MNTFIPKSEFLKKRALDLHRSGENNREIARRLGVSESTIDRWVRAAKPENRPFITEAIDHAERMNTIRWAGSELPTLAYVPHIKLHRDSKYKMVKHGTA